MAAKIAFVLAMAFAISQASVVPAPVAFGPAPVAVGPAPVVLAKLEEYNHHPQYTYAYDVQDSITGNSHAKYETRAGDFVEGSYSLLESDGTRRIVQYQADPINGFTAAVHREPAIPAVPVAAPAVPVHQAPLAPVHAPLAPIAPVAAHPAHLFPAAIKYPHLLPAHHYVH